jgi:hypothetical protein
MNKDSHRGAQCWGLWQRVTHCRQARHRGSCWHSLFSLHFWTSSSHIFKCCWIFPSCRDSPWSHPTLMWVFFTDTHHSCLIFTQPIKYPTYKTTNQTNHLWMLHPASPHFTLSMEGGCILWREWTEEWSNEWAASGPLVIFLQFFWFLYSLISTDQNPGWNLNTVLFMVRLHNQKISWQWILITSPILSR